MATGAYLLIRASEVVRTNGYFKALDELWALPEVEYVEPVSGPYDCVARVEAPITRLISLVDEVLAMSWVDGVHVLRVEQLARPASDWEEARTAKLRQQRKTVEAYRAHLQRLRRSAQRPYAGYAAAIRAELEEARSLSRQLEILKADHERRRTAAASEPDRSG